VATTTPSRADLRRSRNRALPEQIDELTRTDAEEKKDGEGRSAIMRR